MSTLHMLKKISAASGKEIALSRDCLDLVADQKDRGLWGGE